MIIVVLALLGVPLWLCAVAILILVLRNRGLRTRPGDMPVRVLRPGKKHWARGHAVWVSDVFAWRGSPASWNEELAEVVAVTIQAPEAAERKPLHRLGDDVVVAVLLTAEGRTLRAAAAGKYRAALPGPFGAANAPAGRRPSDPRAAAAGPTRATPDLRATS